MSSHDLLRFFAIAYVVVDALHFADHLRQGRLLSPQIYAGGTIGAIVGVSVLVLVLRNHPIAPLTAAAFGVVDAIGVFAVHILPTWSYLSDSYVPLHVDALSWVSAVLLTVTAAGLGLAGIFAALLSRRRARLVIPGR